MLTFWKFPPHKMPPPATLGPRALSVRPCFRQCKIQDNYKPLNCLSHKCKHVKCVLNNICEVQNFFKLVLRKNGKENTDWKASKSVWSETYVVQSVRHELTVNTDLRKIWKSLFWVIQHASGAALIATSKSSS